MAKKKHLVRTIIGIILVLIAVILITIQLFADSALKAGIEVGASKALKVQVKVGDVDLSILAGSLEIEGLEVDNPPGYEYKKLLELNKAKVDVSMRSLLSDEIHIEQIMLDGMTLVIEQKGLTNNLSEIIKNLPKAEKPKVEKPKEEKPKEGKKLVIDNLKITNVSVKVKMLPIPGKKDTFEMKLDPIEMTDLGSDSKLDVATLSSKILVAIASGVAKQGAGILPGEITGSIKGGLKKVTEIGGTMLEESKGLLEETKNIGEKAAERLKGIFDFKKDDK
ncbi:MAG: AsmA family protein [Planctomycetes bacterium]|nr:AsmA family protein [Planctomycetota bacterium]